MARVLSVLWVSIYLLGCSASSLGNELLVELKTDLVPGLEFQTIRTEISSSPESPQAPIVIDKAADAKADYVTGQRIGDFQQLSRSGITVTVSLLDAHNDVVAARPTRVTLTERFGLSVVISRDCRDVQCPLADGDPSLTACFGGRCVDPRCHPLAIEYCGSDPECSLDTECSTPISCNEGQCVENVCFMVANDDLCTDLQYCHPDNGCTNTDLETDACNDDRVNNQETDTDCGGPVCDSCPVGGVCVVDSDCATDYCTSKHECKVPAEQWSTQFLGAGPGLDDITQMASDGSNHIYVTGSYESGTISLGGDTLPPTTGYRSGYVGKFDVYGDPVWSFAIQGITGQAMPRTTAATTSKVYVAGGFLGSIDVGGSVLTSVDSTDAFVAAYDSAAGALLWSKRFGGPDVQRIVDLDRDNIGNMYFVARVVANIDFGGPPLQTNPPFAVVSLNENGDFRWQVELPPSVDVTAIGVGASSVCITGALFGEVDFGGGLVSDGDSYGDIFVACFDHAGEHQWSASYPGDGIRDTGRSIVVNSNGHVIVVGETESTDLDMGGGLLPLVGAEDVFVASFTSIGAHGWSNTFGTPSADYVSEVAVNDSGEVFMVGTAQGGVDFGGGLLPHAGGNDAFVVKLDIDGNHVFSLSYGSSADEWPNAVVSTGQADMTVGGIFRGPIDFGDGVYTPSGSNDVFLLRIAP